MIEWFLPVLVLSCLLLQLIYYWYFVTPFIRYKDTIPTPKTQINQVFFLISIKNEAHQLRNLILSLNKANAENGKIVLVDDHSDEEQWEKAQSIIAEFHHVQLLRSTSIPGKKHALRVGQAQISEGNILLTDADCRVASSMWTTIMSNKLYDSDVVLGYGPFFKTKGFLNKLARFDCSWIAAQYFGWSQRGIPYMAVGRNLAVRNSVYKSTFKSMKGDNIMSGDDDLFVQCLSKEKVIDIAVSKESFMYSHAEQNYTSLLRQKTRQIKTSGYYKKRDQIILSIVAMLNMMIFPLILSTFLISTAWIAWGLLIVKIMLSYCMFIPIAKKLQENDLILFIPLLELAYGIHLVILSFYALFIRNNKWK